MGHDDERISRQAGLTIMAEAALADIGGPLSKWARWDSQKLVSHMMGAISSELRMAKMAHEVKGETFEIPNDKIIFAAILKVVVAKCLQEARAV